MRDVANVAIKKICSKLVNHDNYGRMVSNIIEKSKLFSQQSFADSYSKALDTVVGGTSEDRF